MAVAGAYGGFAPQMSSSRRQIAAQNGAGAMIDTGLISNVFDSHGYASRDYENAKRDLEVMFGSPGPVSGEVGTRSIENLIEQHTGSRKVVVDMVVDALKESQKWPFQVMAFEQVSDGISSWTMEECHFNNEILDEISYRAPPRLMTHSRSSRSESMKRYGRALLVEINALGTQQGMMQYQKSVESLFFQTLLTAMWSVASALMSYGSVYAHMSSPNDPRAVYPSKNQLFEAMNAQTDMAACMIKQSRAIEKITAAAKEEFANRSVGPDDVDTIIIPSGTMAVCETYAPDKMNAVYAGIPKPITSINRDRVTGAAIGMPADVNNWKVIQSCPLSLGTHEGSVDPLRRPFVHGRAMLMGNNHNKNAPLDKYHSDQTNITVYNEDFDSKMDLSFFDALPNAVSEDATINGAIFQALVDNGKGSEHKGGIYDGNIPAAFTNALPLSEILTRINGVQWYNNWLSSIADTFARDKFKYVTLALFAVRDEPRARQAAVQAGYVRDVRPRLALANVSDSDNDEDDAADGVDNTLPALMDSLLAEQYGPSDLLVFFEFIKACYLSNIPPPVSILLLGPHISREMSSAIVCKRGPKLGSIKYNNATFTLSKSARYMELFGALRINMRAVVENRNLIAHVRDVLPVAYHGGGGCRFYSLTHDRNLYSSVEQASPQKDLFCCLVPATFQPERHMDITGQFANLSAQHIPLCYPTARAYAAAWGWIQNQANVLQGEFVSEDQLVYNSICTMDHYETVDHKGERRYSPGQTIMGPDVYGGCAQARIGKRRLKTTNYANMAEVSISMN